MPEEAKELARIASNQWKEDRLRQGFLDDPELGRAFLRKRKDAYERAIKTVECLMAVERIESSKPSAECYLEFYQLYWGGLLIVEDQDVLDCMVNLGGNGKPLVQWAQGTNVDENKMAKENFDELANKFVGMLRDEKIPQTEKCLANTGPIDKYCISFEASSKTCR